MASLIYLGFSIITFIVSYGLLFLIVPATLSSFFSAFSPEGLEPEWLATYNETENAVRYLIPLVPTLGIFVIVLKVLMVASARGGD